LSIEFIHLPPTLILTFMSLELFCLVYPDPDPAQHNFSVHIDKNQTVSDLRKLIKAEKPHRLAHVEANELILWKLEPEVPFSDGLRTALEALHLDISPAGARMLRPWQTVEDFFDEAPMKGHLQIVVHALVPSKLIQISILNDGLSTTYCSAGQ
jgi:hypothetical protein